MLDVKEIAVYAGAVMTIISLGAFLVKPVLSNFSQITENLTKMSHSLDLLNRDLEASKTDRAEIHDVLKRHDERLDNHSEKLVSHDEQLKTLFRNGEK